MSSGMNIPDSTDLATAKWQLDHLKARGFVFERTAPGEDGPLLVRRESGRWLDLVYVQGFSHDCMAWRERLSPLVLPGRGGVDRHISGGAVEVFGEVLSWEPEE
jgi:hypothetical protein